jgi:ribose 5-phosphate isomerase A
MNFKRDAAAKAISLVTENSIVGLGAGSTVAHAVDLLKQEIKKGLSVKFITSSFSTLQLLLKEKLPVFSAPSFKEIDIYLDGCDQFDHELNAVKSGGGIHTREKLLASMAKQFVLVGDESKLADTFDAKYPLVFEILPEAALFVPYKIEKMFEVVKISMRINGKKDGPVVTENGNYLLDLYFERWPELSVINPALQRITGIVETSLFYGIAHKAIIAGANGVRTLERTKG